MHLSVAISHVKLALKSGLGSWGLRVMRGCNALQTYEGGLGGEPGNEAHGGYTFCGLAALMLVGRASVLNLPSLLRWAVHRQVATPHWFLKQYLTESVSLTEPPSKLILSTCSVLLRHLSICAFFCQARAAALQLHDNAGHHMLSHGTKHRQHKP